MDMGTDVDLGSEPDLDTDAHGHRLRTTERVDTDVDLDDATDLDTDGGVEGRRSTVDTDEDADTDERSILARTWIQTCDGSGHGRAWQERGR